MALHAGWAWDWGCGCNTSTELSDSKTTVHGPSPSTRDGTKQMPLVLLGPVRDGALGPEPSATKERTYMAGAGGGRQGR